MKVDRCNSFSSNFLILMMLWQSVVITVRLIATLPECYNSTSQDMGSNKKATNQQRCCQVIVGSLKLLDVGEKNILHPEYKIISFPQLWNRLCQPSTKLGDDMKRSMVKKKTTAIHDACLTLLSGLLQHMQSVGKQISMKVFSI